MPNLQHKRGTRAALVALAGGGGLLPGQVYALTDESRLALATSATTFETFAKQSEAGGGGGGVSVQTVEVNFTAPRDSQTFIVTVAGALTSQRVIASFSGNMPVGVDADELEMDPLSVAGSVTAADQVTLVVSSTTGSRIRGRRNINLILG